MSFDVFGDFETRGYLRNHEAEKDMAIVGRLEDRSFVANVGKAIDAFHSEALPTANSVLNIHKILFSDVYPWAGRDRHSLVPNLLIDKGGDSRLFAFGKDVTKELQHAVDMGNDPDFTRAKPGVVMGALAFSHPFLDGNGRSILVAHSIFSDRAGISIDWQLTDKTAYLRALTAEIKVPDQGYLDDYLKPFIRPPIDRMEQMTQLLKLPGLSVGQRMSLQDPQATNAVQKTKPELQK